MINPLQKSPFAFSNFLLASIEESMELTKMLPESVVDIP